MSILPYIVELFFREKTPQSNGKGIKFLGYLLILTGTLSSFYFLFKTLTPILGYGESGILVCGLTIGLGCIILMMNRPQPLTYPLNNLIETTSEVLKNNQLQEFIHQNGTKIFALAFLTGLLLSQQKK